MRVESPAINCDSSRMCLTISPAQQQGETHVVLVPPPLFALTPRLNTLCTTPTGNTGCLEPDTCRMTLARNLRPAVLLKPHRGQASVLQGAADSSGLALNRRRHGERHGQMG